MKAPPVALGFRIKSGYAIAVAVAGPAASPTPLVRRVVELNDPDNDATRQPYHDGFGTAQEDETVIARLTGVIVRRTRQSIADLLADEALARRRCAGAALVVGSVIDPAAIGNPHIRAHASEGRLFRSVVENSLRAHGIASMVIVEKKLAAEAVTTLRRPEGEIRRTMTAFGKTLGSPWRTEEKSAATAAWMALA